MQVSQTLNSAFDHGDRARGQSYYENGAVQALRVSPDGLLFAEVDGAYGSYAVTVNVDEANDEFLSCECLRFADGFNCKHIWAAILEYESKLAHNRTPGQRSRKNAIQKAPANTKKYDPGAPVWQSLLSGNEFTTLPGPGNHQNLANSEKEILYVIDAGANSFPGREALELFVLQRVRKQNGRWGRLNRLRGVSVGDNSFEDPFDEQIVAHLPLFTRRYHRSYEYPSVGVADSQLDVNDNSELCDLLIASERFFWTIDEDHDPEFLYPISSACLESPCVIRAIVSDVAKPKHAAELRFIIEQGGKRIDDDQIVKLADDGSGLLTSSLVRIANPEAIHLWRNARAAPPIQIKKSERTRFLKQLAATAGAPEIQFPKSWSVDSTVAKPVGLIKLNEAQWGSDFEVHVQFTYGANQFSRADNRNCGFDEETNQWIQRDLAAESELFKALVQVAFLVPAGHGNRDFYFNRRFLMQLVDELGENGWEIILLGNRIKRAGEFDIAVESGQDWFDLSAEVTFDGESIPLPSLLAAIANKEHFITLADGARGRLPVELLEKYARLAQFGEVADDKIRFRPTQAMLLDAMLSAQDGVRVDKMFQSICRKIKSFSGIKPKKPTRGFQGKLRAYQQDGLGWLHFLRDFGFGGCLADDMGLGKTVQVLAMLESRRIRRITDKDESNSSSTKVEKKQAVEKKTAKPKSVTKSESKSKTGVESNGDVTALVEVVTSEKRKPSIIVVPKSLIFNWIDEAEKFTPRLRVLNYTGIDRKSRASESGGFDVLITTYGTMNKDIADLTTLEFDYAILDESQAIKNAKTQCARASRLLRADHRLAMTGTPIENHIGELWSLFEFLNPGMLGSSTKFASLTRQKQSSDDDRKETLESLSKALQPFILRRTKEQVLTDLPAKTEQTLYCEMLPAQKKKYDELKEYYRVKLAKKVATVGLGQAKIHVLEALLRLRQVACDPRLIDNKQKRGAKIELLQQQIGEVVAEGHKVLVFSQFTSLLALVRDHFDASGVTYEYLDGKTSNRKQCVERFQTNSEISAFLISLKAGGHGLNLTAADYVYLLDPWWNPAVEAQAVDRAHRMGQQRPVIAYRMICRDTVEEKIVELQESKRELADSIIRADESLIRTLTTEDLTLLLG